MKNNYKKIAPRVKGGRTPKSSGLHPKVARIVNQTAREFNCSKSFVIATALSEFFKVKEEGKFYE